MGSPGKKQFPLRLDPALWEEIERLAAIELRSSNAQIELLLREALKRRGIKPAPSPSARRGRPPVAGESPAEGDGDPGADASADDGDARDGRDE
ncbi:hypothetical protein [Mitsuaria sp. GD03876]|uniref:hypothetical protein n=1 Tax=Mitsuaria sp. GD03876 TaxID=2975399 RepID=UPI00244B42FB|nr:hypothetical protein [Mitsuaria sp. GD03876]MDH0865544.1 hypothetical protein [Mitsuaria sp. GD03876]